MIKIENVEVVGWEHVIRGMRNPKNSWDRSDSGVGCNHSCHYSENPIYRPGRCVDCNMPMEAECYESHDNDYIIGPNDHKLMTNLSSGGPVHAKYRRMIAVYMDITAPLYWWKEFDTYKVGTVANSCSTMHKIHDKEFTLEDFSCEHLTKGSINALEHIIDCLNDSRDWYLKYDHMLEKDKVHFDPVITCKKDLWWQMIQLLPSSYNQKRTIMLNYEVLVGMYKWRKDHKLDEWREFCKWIESLPYSELITNEN